MTQFNIMPTEKKEVREYLESVVNKFNLFTIYSTFSQLLAMDRQTSKVT